MPYSYILEICAPNSIEDVVQTFESTTPFLSISKGDLMNPRTWNNYNYQGKILKVVGVEHIIWKNEKEVKHKICIFTEETNDSEKSRTNN